MGIVSYLFCVLICYCWQMKGFYLEQELWHNLDEKKYTQIEADYYLNRLETDKRQMWLWSFIGGFYLMGPVYLLIFKLFE
ncbi:MAG: hypothetical protein CMK44_07745 [Porticoccus sp.]|jgi:hypothetical protein|nr:hypothetical protein [Porticoccus sp.]